MKTLTFGGWYQRTGLHLTEVHKFISKGSSNLELSSTKLERLRKSLDIKKIKRNQSYLESLELETNSGIIIRYYEDGLYVFSKKTNDVEKDSLELKKYFIEKWKPAIDYIFSLGAPTPKILSNMKDNHPIVVGSISTSLRKKKLNPEIYGKVYSESKNKDAHVYKTSKCIVVEVLKKNQKSLYNLIEMQIFFREFKLQLHKYLDLHRKIWEKIAKIKEKKTIRGYEVEEEKSKLEDYETTISLIENRINQMSSYAKTRASLVKKMKLEETLITHFQYKHEDLLDTLQYIKEIWKVTYSYVKSALQIMRDLSNKNSTKGLKSIQLFASIGVIVGLVRFANTSSLQKVDAWGVSYMLMLALIAFGLDSFIKKVMRKKKYKIKFSETVNL